MDSGIYSDYYVIWWNWKWIIFGLCTQSGNCVYFPRLQIFSEWRFFFHVLCYGNGGCDILALPHAGMLCSFSFHTLHIFLSQQQKSYHLDNNLDCDEQISAKFLTGLRKRENRAPGSCYASSICVHVSGDEKVWNWGTDLYNFQNFCWFLKEERNQHARHRKSIFVIA